jgi:hypothetical protein
MVSHCSEPRVNLLVRINLPLVVIFVIAALAAGIVCRSVMQANAKREALTRAGLMMDSAAALRDYTESEILPLLDQQLKSEFLPQSVPLCAATQNFLQLHRDHPQYSYKEATLIPPICAIAPWIGKQTSARLPESHAVSEPGRARHRRSRWAHSAHRARSALS